MILNVTYQFIGEIKWVFSIKFEKWKRWNFAIECSPSCLVFSNLYPKTFEWNFASATLSVRSFLMIWYTLLILRIHEDKTSTSFSIESQDITANLDVIKWGASFWWLSSLYCQMRNSEQKTIGKTHPSLYSHRYWNSSLYTRFVKSLAPFQ